MRRKISSYMLLLALCGLVVVTVGSCGYYHPDRLPAIEQGQPINLYVPIWANNTSELGLETALHNALNDWLLQSRRITLSSRLDASYLLTGTVVLIDYKGASYRVSDQLSALTIVLTVSYAIKEKDSGIIVWQRDNHTFRETYSVGATVGQTEINKQQALASIVDDLAEQIYIRVLRIVLWLP